MIELLLQAEGALGLGLLERAEQIYWQAIARDPQNAIAVVGLARVAIERGDERTALAFGRRALDIDPENAVARRLTARLEEVLAYRGEAPVPEPASVSAPVANAPEPAAPEVELALAPVSVAAAPEPTAPPPRGLLDRLLRRG